MNRLALSFAGLLIACADGTAPTPVDDGTTPPPSTTSRPPVTYHKDGTVETGGKRFGSIEEFQRSADFRDHGRRCASDRVPVAARAARTDCSMASTTILDEYGGSEWITIPVVFHVIQKTDGTGHVPEALVHSQIDVLNEDFAPAHIRFELADLEYVTNNAYFVDPGSGVSPMKSALRRDPSKFFNVYTNDANGALGYATFPSESAGDADDGVVLLYTSVGRNAPQGGIYNGGRTATHEVGHYLGLFHSFQGGCGSASNPYGSGDLIKDTPAHGAPDYECTVGTSTCGAWNNPIENYMDYTPDACMTGFTVEQTNRMRCSILNYRNELVSMDTGGNEAPTAAFTVATAGLKVTLTNTSSDSDGTIAARAWTFGDGGTSTAASPVHTYAAAGTYTVTLTVTDDDGATDTTSTSVTVTAAATSAALTSGVPVTGLAASTGGQRAYYIDVPAGAASLSVTLQGGSGDADLYLKRGTAPTTSSYDARSYRSGNNESIVLDAPVAGRYHVLVDAYTAFSGVTLVATTTSESGAGYSAVESNLGAAVGDTLAFSVDVPAGATNLSFRISGGTGDADLYVRHGEAPTATAYDYRPYEAGNDETVTVMAPQAGTWHVVVHAYQAFSGVTLRVAYD